MNALAKSFAEIVSILDRHSREERRRMLAALGHIIGESEAGAPSKPPRRQNAPGAGRPGAFSDEEVRAFRDAHQRCALDVTALAKEKQLSRASVYNMLGRHTYRHVK